MRKTMRELFNPGSHLQSGDPYRISLGHTQTSIERQHHRIQEINLCHVDNELIHFKRSQCGADVAIVSASRWLVWECSIPAPMT